MNFLQHVNLRTLLFRRPSIQVYCHKSESKPKVISVSSVNLWGHMSSMDINQMLAAWYIGIRPLSCQLLYKWNLILYWVSGHLNMINYNIFSHNKTIKMIHTTNMVCVVILSINKRFSQLCSGCTFTLWVWISEVLFDESVHLLPRKIFIWSSGCVIESMI